MFGSNYLTTKTRIFLLGFILIVLPGAIIGYLSLESLNQKEENLKVKYKTTISLVRDKLESDVLKSEADLKNSAIERFSTNFKNPELKAWLQKMESDYLTFDHLFFVNKDGGLLSSSISYDWNDTEESQLPVNTRVSLLIDQAEKNEYIDKDFKVAIKYYKSGLKSTSILKVEAFLWSRIGRCYFKLGNYLKGINAYKEILQMKDQDIIIGDIPASIIALLQISNGYESLRDTQNHFNTQMELYEELLDAPMDLKGGSYLYYLNAVQEGLKQHENWNSSDSSFKKEIEDLTFKRNNLDKKIRFMEYMRLEILPNMVPELRNNQLVEVPSSIDSQKENNTTSQIGFFNIPVSYQQSESFVIGYQFNKEYILSNVFPEILTTVALGKDVVVGILDEKDSLMYIHQSENLVNYLVFDNFSQLFLNWKVALFDVQGNTIAQLVGKERRLYMMLFLGIIVVMLVGVVIVVRAVMHEMEVSRLKSEFVSNVSHELKTPLALIRMFGETLDSGVVTDENKRKEFYRIIRKESERLTHLINDVLDFSKLDKGVKKFYMEESDIVEIIKYSLEAYKFHIRENGFKIEKELPDEKILLRIDKDSISQAILNLLSNAVKYSKDEKFILVNLYKDSSSVFISITDKGIGIAKNDLKKIFDKFYRVPTLNGKERRGNGLGLTLTKHIIKAHGGELNVVSEIGKGSTFTITLPLIK